MLLPFVAAARSASHRDTPRVSRRAYHRILRSSSSPIAVRSAGLPAVRRASQDDTADDTTHDTVDNAANSDEGSAKAAAPEVGGGEAGEDGARKEAAEQREVRRLRRGMAAARTTAAERSEAAAASSSGTAAATAIATVTAATAEGITATRPTNAAAAEAASAGATAEAAWGKKPRRRAAPRGISPHWTGKGKQCGRQCGVLNNPIALYVVWYGVFSAAQKSILRSFVASLSPSADAAVTVPLWWNINRLYYDKHWNYISGIVTLKGETEDAEYSLGTTLPDAAVDTLIVNAVKRRQLPYDEDGVYFVVSDENVHQVSEDIAFCKDYCGWHWYTKVPGRGLLVSGWIGNAIKKCRSTCIASQVYGWPNGSPNNDPGMDGLLSVFAHEIAEAASDPFASTWFDSDGEENADKCSWQYGELAYDPEGSLLNYNLVGVNDSKFLIQQNWDLSRGECVTMLPYSALPPPRASKSPAFGWIGRWFRRMTGRKP